MNQQQRKDLVVSFLIILASLLILSVGGKIIASEGIAWYHTLTLPVLTPPNWVYPIVWPILYACIALSAALFIKNETNNERKQKIIFLYMLNAVANFSWTFLFFRFQEISLAFWDTVFVCLTGLVLVVLLLRHHRLSAALLVPYVLYTGFASYIAWQMMLLNAG